jgi:crotonobetainyl-CoA hydratase
MGDQEVLTEQDGHVLVVTINRPDALNAVNLAVTVGIGEALERAERTRGIWVVVLTGTGRAFCAGADLKALAAGQSIAPQDPGQAAWGFAGFARHHISKPTIAAVNGLALGGGTEIVLSADLAVAAQEARFGLPEVKRGILAGGGGAFRLPQQVPKKVAMEMIMTGDPIGAPRAYELGLVNQVVPAAELMPACLRLAERICTAAPLSVQASKRIADGLTDGRLPAEDEAWSKTKSESSALLGTADRQEGLRAFTEKRPPRWTASLPI